MIGVGFTLSPCYFQILDSILRRNGEVIQLWLITSNKSSSQSKLIYRENEFSSGCLIAYIAANFNCRRWWMGLGDRDFTSITTEYCCEFTLSGIIQLFVSGGSTNSSKRSYYKL